ncbi:MAG: PEP-CTERM sorting domain-containing protein [Thalassotalea sp.]
MIKKITSLFLAAFLMSSANAGIIDQTVDINNWFNSAGESESWTHDINGPLFNPATMNVESAVISFDFYDDNGNDGRDVRFCFWGYCPAGNFEYADVFIQNLNIGNNGSFEIDSGLFSQNIGISGLLSLSDTGLLDVTITRVSGDFGLRSSTLSVVTAADENLDSTVSVPEPASLFLLSLGMIGFTLSRRAK